ncbi:hypothetical protein FA10DRAFT_174043 [Acaromyces ingoldii]|uniref:Uncharacterized protein n=1 Tax=Acaromyces ingoldii TaxID=215250 RepID=A0A316YGD7_9BASI|nr:hypothetical protein FA10DRAFT_174043 [Acaromyces ingoldii]PWN87658.1 hypothetical protein FA10DRAFT_174043 [Acaromyces ingoldii]
MADENGRGRGDGEGARDKGKGKGKSKDTDTDTGKGRQAGGGLLSSVASAGAGGMPGELARMLASQGKASSVGSGAGAAGASGGMAGAYIDDARAAAAGAISSRSSASTTGFRSAQEASSGASASASAGAGERSYAGFAAPPAMATAGSAFLGQADAHVGPYSSASDLDVHLHDYVRRSSQQQQQQWDDHGNEAELEGAWRDARQPQQQRRQGFDPMTMLDVESEDQHEFAQDDFIAALEREERELPPQALTPLQQLGQGGQQQQRQAGAEVGTTTEALGSVLPAGVPLVDRWTADGQGITREQYEMHRRLHLAQRGALSTGTQGQSNDSIDEEAQRRADEAVKPPDDDEVAQTGVYAPTVELAFSAIWDGEAEGQRALERLRAASVEEAHARQQEARSSSSTSQPSSSHLQREKARRLAARLRAWVARGSYVDDVYGLPPELDKTLRDAEGPEEGIEEEEDEGAKEKRAKAIRRLEALQQHLVGAAEGATGTPRVSLDDVERFLRERR